MGAKDETNDDAHPVPSYVRGCGCNIRVVVPPVEGGVDVILIKENIILGMVDVDIP